MILSSTAPEETPQTASSNQAFLSGIGLDKIIILRLLISVDQKEKKRLLISEPNRILTVFKTN